MLYGNRTGWNEEAIAEVEVHSESKDKNGTEILEKRWTDCITEVKVWLRVGVLLCS